MKEIIEANLNENLFSIPIVLLLNSIQTCRIESISIGLAKSAKKMNPAAKELIRQCFLFDISQALQFF